MKIAFIFGKGIDGCGVTRGAIIFEKWVRSQGHETVVIDFNNGVTYNRSQQVSWMGPVRTIDSNWTVKDCAGILKELNACDIAIFHSHPTRKQFEYAERYRQFLSLVKGPIIVMHDHSISRINITAVPQACELFGMADTVVAQSPAGYSFDAYTAFDPGLKNNFIENPIWIVPGEYDKFRLEPEKREKHFLYMGRMAPLKDPALVCRASQHLSEDWKISLIGCESSISSVTNSTTKDRPLSIDPAPYRDEWLKIVKRHRLNSKGVYMMINKDRNSTGRIMAYELFKYDWGMKQLGSSFASWSGYRLVDPIEYGHRMEYTMVESFLLTLPVVSRHFAENATSPSGKKWGEYGCALVSQATEEEALADELNRLWSAPKEWKARTEACRILIQRFNDIKVLGPQYLDQVLKNGHRANKVDGISRIAEYFPSAPERRARGEIVMSSAGGVLNRTPMIMGPEGRQIEIEEAGSKIDPLTAPDTLEEFFG